MGLVEDLQAIGDAIRPALQEHEAREPGVTDQPCTNCGGSWFCEKGQNGKVYCDICLGRGRDEEDGPPDHTEPAA